jgi:ATP-dependent helicase/nuclease subunit A
MSNKNTLNDQRSRDRIVSELDKNLLVEAGAGSGKTHMMAARMAAGVASGVYAIERMAAVTFTRKAAAELRGRFQLALESELARASDVNRANRLRSALSNLERFFAGTIHSFCAHLLRERPVEAGISPGFTELEEVQDTLLRRQSWRDYRTQAKGAGDPLILELLDAGIRASDLDRAFDTVCLYEEVSFPSGEATCPETSIPWKALDEFWGAIVRKLPQRIPEDTTCGTQRVARRFFGQIRVAAGQRGRPAALVPLLELWDFTPRIVQYQWSEDPVAKKRIARGIEALHGAFRTNTIEPFLLQWRQYIYRIGITLLTRARTQVATDRRRQNTLNYGDLLQLTARVLRTNADVRRALQEKYRWLFVDEFQDTDPVQAEIMFLLSGEPEPPGGTPQAAVTDWRKARLRPGALFVVGDPKQSIYRFRRADIDIYNEVSAKIGEPGKGEALPLTTNFRSLPSLCEWANNAFRQQFPLEPSAYSPKFAPLDANRPSGKSGTGVFTLTIAATVEERGVATAEAEKIARFIRGEVDAHRRTWGDFLILTRKKKNLEQYSSALEALEIPVEVNGAGAFGDSQEVRQLALLLNALADPQDSVSLVGVLRGPLFGLSDQELFAYRQAGGWFSIFAEITSKIPEVAPVAAAIASLRQMFRWTQMMPVGAALERILEHTGYLALAATSPGGVEAGDLFHAVDRVRSVVEDGLSLIDAAAALEDDAEESSEVESLPLEPGRGDVVRLMNLHKAKGLEAPVVFLADPCGGVGRWADVRIIRDGMSARGYFQLTREFGRSKKVVAEPAGWADYEAEELRYLEAEESRLLYVAATRARDALIIGQWAKAGGKSKRAWAVFDPFLGGARELEVPHSVTLPSRQNVDLSATAADHAKATMDAAHSRVRSPSWSTSSVTSEARHVPKIVRAEDAAADDPTRVVSTDTPSRRADAGMLWGTLVHGLLEHAMRHKTATRDDLRRLAMWLTIEEPELRAVIDDALDTVQAVSGAEFWKEARTSAECHEETPFGMRIEGEAVMKLLSGAIDLVYRTGEGWHLLDYKTDTHGSDADLRAKYGPQIDAYEKAWSRIAKLAVTTTLVQALRTDGSR